MKTKTEVFEMTQQKQKAPLRKITHKGHSVGKGFLTRFIVDLECGHRAVCADPNQKRTRCYGCNTPAGEGEEG